MFVVCDFCEKDYSDSDEKGGLLFQSRAVCPLCSKKIEKDAIKYGEEKYIRARCPADKTFREFVLDVREEQLRKIISEINT